MSSFEDRQRLATLFFQHRYDRIVKIPGTDTAMSGYRKWSRLVSALAPISHIESTPRIAGGKPRIFGRRITVQDIVIWHERMRLSVDEIASDHDLTLSEVYAALSFYFDHRVEIDDAIDSSNAYIEMMRADIPSVLQQRLSETVKVRELGHILYRS